MEPKSENSSLYCSWFREKVCDSITLSTHSPIQDHRKPHASLNKQDDFPSCSHWLRDMRALVPRSFLFYSIYISFLSKIRSALLSITLSMLIDRLEHLEGITIFTKNNLNYSNVFMVNDLTPGQLSLAYFSIYQEAIIQAVLIRPWCS